MKKLTLAISTLALMAGFSSAFAAMSVIEKSQNVISDPHQAFIGNVAAAGYFNQDNDPTVIIAVTEKDNQDSYVVIAFNGADLTAGAAFINTVNKPLGVFFADKNYTIGGLLTDGINPAKSTLANFRKKLQSR